MDKELKIAYLNFFGSMFYIIALLVLFFGFIYSAHYITSNSIGIDFSMDNNTANAIKDVIKISNITKNQDYCPCKVFRYNIENKTYELVD